MTRRKTPVVAVTCGDWNGIGPEVALKTCVDAGIGRLCRPLLVGPMPVFEQYARRLGIAVRLAPWEGVPRRGRGNTTRTLDVVEPGGAAGVRIAPGRVSRAAGQAAYAAIVEGVRLVRAGLASALVTAPVSKSALHRAGIETPGQTELLQRLTSAGPVAMILASRFMRVGLATIHLPLRDVARTLTRPLLRERIGVMHASLRQDWGIRAPRIAVLGLNPHAGENGDLGDEERTVIAPVLAALRRARMAIDGPFPADGFFGSTEWKRYDLIVAMYHDQGLIPLKLSGFRSGVNITAGLPFIRTSPDHGTAFAIAGKGIADPSSMRAAVRCAILLASTRARTSIR